MNINRINKKHSFSLPVFFFILAITSISMCNAARAMQEPDTALTTLTATTETAVSVAESVAGSGFPNWVTYVLLMKRVPVSGSELSEYRWPRTSFNGVLGVGFGISMALNLYMVSGNEALATRAMFGTFFLAAIDVYEALQFGRYILFFKKLAPGSELSATTKLGLTGAALGAMVSGVIIAMADADAAGRGVAKRARKFCNLPPETPANSTEPVFDPSICSASEDGYYTGCEFATGNGTSTRQGFTGCEWLMYGSGVALSGIPTAVVGATSVYHVAGFLLDVGSDMVSAIKSLVAKGISAKYVTQAQQVAMDLQQSMVSTLTGAGYAVTDVQSAAEVLNNPETSEAAYKVLAENLRGSLSKTGYAEAMTHLQDGTLLASRAAAGLIKDVAIVAGLITTAYFGYHWLTDTFNSGKNNEYIMDNGFASIKAGNGTYGDYVVRLPDGNFVDPYHPDYKVDSDYIDSFDKASATNAQLISKITYSGQSLLAATFGVIKPVTAVTDVIASAYLTHKLANAASKSTLALYPASIYAPIAFALGGAATVTGGYYYFRNLDGAKDSINKVKAYRKAVGDESEADVSAETMIAGSQALLGGLFTFAGNLAINTVVMFTLQQGVRGALLLKSRACGH